MVRIVAISDTHDEHHQLAVPDGDILICAGDFTGSGTRKMIESFLMWMQRQTHRHKILIAGNHDRLFESRPAEARELVKQAAPDVTYLQDMRVIRDGLLIYGAPWTPRFYDWAFNLGRGREIARKWEQIPDKVDILVTHGPPKGTLDRTPGGESVGCEALAARLQFVKPRLHVFGHIHHSYGIEEKGGTISVNAAICNERYRAAHEPLVVDL